MADCNCDRKIAELQEEVEDCALPSAWPRTTSPCESTTWRRNRQPRRDGARRQLLQDVLDEIRTLCNIPWDVTNNALPDYLSRASSTSPPRQEMKETSPQCNSNTIHRPHDADTFTCSCCGATAAQTYRCASWVAPLPECTRPTSMH